MGRKQFMADLTKFTGTKTWEDAVQWAVDAGIEQIISDVVDGEVPLSIDKFSDLHDYTDANKYGRAFEWPGKLPCDTDDGEYVAAFSYFWDAVQNRLDRWIEDGYMADECHEALAQQKDYFDMMTGDE